MYACELWRACASDVEDVYVSAHAYLPDTHRWASVRPGLNAAAKRAGNCEVSEPVFKCAGACSATGEGTAGLQTPLGAD